MSNCNVGVKHLNCNVDNLIHARLEVTCNDLIFFTETINISQDQYNLPD